MNRRTAIILTVAAALLCGCPGLVGCLWGAIAVSGGLLGNLLGVGPITVGTYAGQLGPTASRLVGVGAVCISLILIATPVAVGFFTLRRRPASSA